MKSLHFNASNYRKINFRLTSNIDLVFYSLENQKRLAQTKVHYIFFSLSETKRLTNIQK